MDVPMRPYMHMRDCSYRHTMYVYIHVCVSPLLYLCSFDCFIREYLYTLGYVITFVITLYL